MRALVWCVVACLLPAVVGCKGPRGEPPLDTRVRILLTDAPLDEAGVTRVLVTFTSIEVHSQAQDAWLTVVDYGAAGRTFDLLSLRNGITEELGAFNLPPGTYDQIRLHLSADNEIEVNEGQGPVLLPLKVPSGEQTGIKLVREFTVTGEGPTEITVDFDAEKSVKRTGHGWQVQPVIRIIATSTAEHATRVVGPEGGTVRLLNEGEVEIPPGALSSEVEISILAREVSEETAARQGILGSSLVEIGPRGTQLAKPVRVTVWCDKDELERLPGHAVRLLSKDRGGWVEWPAVVDGDLGTVSGWVPRLAGADPAGLGVDAAEVQTTSFVASSYITSIGLSDMGALIPGQVGEVKATLDADVDGAELFDVLARSVSWSASTSLVQLRAPDCNAAPPCPNAAGRRCLWDETLPNGGACDVDQRYRNVLAIRHPGAEVKAEVGGSSTAPARKHAPVMGLMVTFHNMYVRDDGDNLSEGDLYWWLAVNDVVADHQPSDQGYSSGDTIHINKSTPSPISVGIGDAVTVKAHVWDDDGGANGEDDHTWLENLRVIPGDLGFHDDNTNHGDSDPDLDVRYTLWWSP